MISEKTKEYRRQWALANKEHITARRKQYFLDNPDKAEKLRFYHQEYQRSRLEVNRDRHNLSMREWRAKNPDIYRRQLRESYHRNAEKRREDARAQRRRIASDPTLKSEFGKRRNAYRSKKRLTNPDYRIACVLRTRTKEAIRKIYGTKSHKTTVLLGVTVSECRKHIESLWKPRMTWENYGRHGWHIDHIRPCASFDLTDPEQQKLCFHYTNLQPLWWFDNLSKGAK